MSGLEGLLAGRLLGDRYRIEEVIGRGGMGAVYRAVDERLGRQVAVKVITAVTGDDSESRERLKARFYREARSAAALPHHPNVVPVYDYGSDPTLGLDYLVMELLRGSDLATRLARSGPPPLAAALKILYESARGLAVGHRSGMIHRDVKPGNIFLAESDHHEIQVRMVDFGIAKLADDEGTFNDLTQDGRIPHSPAFASPEQLRGLSQLTPASDVFSLGAVGFTLLTGERPFTDADRNRLSLGMPVPVPSLRDRNPAIPASVDAIVQKALAYDAADRYPDAAAMANALGEALRTMPETALEPYSTTVAVPPSRTGPVAPAAPLAATDDDRTRLFDQPGDDDRTLLAPHTPRPVDQQPLPIGAVDAPIEVPSRRARAQRKRRGIGGMLVWALVLLVLATAGVWAWVEYGRRATGLADLPLPADTVAEEQDTTPAEPLPQAEPTELDAAAFNQEGVRLFQEGDVSRAHALFARAVEISPRNADYRRNLGLALMKMNSPAEAAAELQQAIELDPNRSIAYANLAEAQVVLGDTVGAIQSLEQFVSRNSDRRLGAVAERRLAELVGAAQPATIDTVPAPLPMDTGLIRIDTSAVRRE